MPTYKVKYISSEIQEWKVEAASTADAFDVVDNELLPEGVLPDRVYGGDIKFYYIDTVED